MKFQFIAGYQGSLSRSHLCRMTGVTDRGLRAWLRRPPSIRQRPDMVILAHIREQHRLSLGSYGRPCQAAGERDANRIPLEFVAVYRCHILSP
ncbi:hypothetical protein PARHAE_03572 [Paracoccus haematequi]|uniref:Uncharacterized protein n=1 Tax=Paracoccus haematequi TaxID=2491866 RepID=A0A3S4CM88_9RHOB|nr:hypothetical protein [Paracoccus haematequi]VDS10358.1 hypothetical protein PARHAE_03572 [Paracoccus haematequi]